MKSKYFFIFSLLVLHVTLAANVFAEDAPAPAPTVEPTKPAGDSYQAVAQKPKAEHFTLTKGGFFQAGGLLGLSMDPLNALDTGISTALGFQINSYVGIYARSDLFVLLDDSATHLGFTFIPSARFTIIDNFYGFVGVGYALTYAPQNSTIAGSVGGSISRSYHSFNTEAGLGYVFLLSKSFGLFGEGGLNYTYISKADFVQTEMWRPFGRAGLSLQF